MRTILEILDLSKSYLEKKGIAHPRRQAEELLGEALGTGRMGLYLEFDRPLTDAEVEKCRGWLKRRGEGEPLQYISGSVQFMDCRIKVDHNVLIPRQETEILADKIIAELTQHDVDGKSLWEVCCGSGCLGIALKKKMPSLNVALSDISEEALAVAKANSSGNNAPVELLLGDLMAPFKGRKADFIVCNPPYISEEDYNGLDVEVRGHEPKRALVGGESGIEFYERLAQDLPKYLNARGKVWFEIGDGQAAAIKKLFSAPCWTHCAHACDWSGKERFISLEFE